MNVPKRSNCPGCRLKAKKMNIAARNSDPEESKRRPLERTAATRSPAQPPNKSPGMPARPKVMAASVFFEIERVNAAEIRGQESRDRVHVEIRQCARDDDPANRGNLQNRPIGRALVWPSGQRRAL